MVDVMVVDVGGVVDLLGRRWWRWWWCTTISWAGGSTHWSHALVSAGDCASLFCEETQNKKVITVTML